MKYYLFYCLKSFYVHHMFLTDIKFSVFDPIIVESFAQKHMTRNKTLLHLVILLFYRNMNQLDR